MLRPELYQKTVDILVQAYFNDTLRHGSCSACAVGNIIAANNNIETEIDAGGLYWENSNNWYCELILGYYEYSVSQKVVNQIKNTGYSIPEIISIEDAFEAAEYYDDTDRMFNGLMNVIEVLDQIHENKDAEVTKVSKAKFVKA